MWKNVECVAWKIHRVWKLCNSWETRCNQAEMDWKLEGERQLSRTCFTQDISDLIVHFALALEARDERWIYNNGGGRKRDWKVGRGAWSIICWAVVRIEVLAANRTAPTISSLSSSAPAFSTETTFMVRAHRSPTSRKCEGHLKIIRHNHTSPLLVLFFANTM